MLNVFYLPQLAWWGAHTCPTSAGSAAGAPSFLLTKLETWFLQDKHWRVRLAIISHIPLLASQVRTAHGGSLQQQQ